MNKDDILHILQSHTGSLQDMGLTALGLFGSFAQNDQDADSDVDLLYQTNQQLSLSQLLNIQQKLEELLGRSVDLIPADALDPLFANQLKGDDEEISFIPIYGTLTFHVHQSELSTREAVARVRQRFDRSRQNLDPAAIRAGMKLSQGQFAAVLGISTRTLQNWEQGHRRPTGPARQLLRVVARYPELVKAALG